MERRRPSRLELAEPMTKTVRRRERPRERWLLTRKTWKYMSDAGRRLIPDGAQNRLEDVPRLEVYFQEVCQKEPRFLLWRKSSYPGVLPKPRRKKRPRGGSVRARSPSDDVALSIARPSELYIPHTSGGRFDIAKLRRDFFAAPAPSSAPAPRPSTSLDNGCSNASEDEGVLVDLLRKYLKLEDEKTSAKVAESAELVSSLRNYLKKHSDRRPADSDSDPTQRILREHLSRYHSGSSNRDNIVQDLLSDRNSLRSLYHDLRKPKPYRGGRSGGYGGGGGYGSSGVGAPSPRSGLRSRVTSSVNFNDNYSHGSPKSPPPLIEVFGESLEERLVDVATQTLPIPEEVLAEIERQYREKVESATAPTSPTSPPNERRPRRRSSVDHDDVSQSVSDTIKRYLRMARKKSVDAEKTDRFKRINYDKNLRNIKPRPPNEVDDDGFHKGCQTDEAWITSYRDMQFASVASTPTSPLSPTQSHSFLSTLLGKNAAVSVPSGAMQKSRSSSSVVQSVGKRLWRTRSRSSSRAVATWTPQGSCVWADGAGRQVRLADTSLLSLSEVERRALQQAALARLKELHLGTIIKIPEENATAVTTKPKRRAHLLKRKALTTSFFDQSRTKDGDKDKESSGSVFGVPLTQCVEAERALRRQHGGSRVSLASLSGLEKGDDSDTCDSGECLGLEDGEGCPKVPKIVSACLAHLRRHGLRTRGLFRVSASIKRVRQLREEWESGVESALDGAVCPHDVATLLKEFLRDLPDPLLCRDLYPAFLSTQKIRNPKLQWEALRLLVHLLPAAHRDTLHALLSFLSLLASHCADDVQASKEGNMMNAANIATIFAPNILHKNKGNEAAGSEQLSERTDVIDVVRTLVERQAELWTLPAELLHEAYVHLAHSAPAQLDALLLHRADCAAESVSPTSDSKRVWTREALLHTDTATQMLMNRELLHNYNSTVLTARSSGTQDSNDSASDYNEAGVTSEDECVITASLRIPGVRARRRSTSGSSSGKRDSAVGSSAPSPSPASPASSTSPPASPPHAPPRLVALGRERITSDARAVAVRQHDESVTRSRITRSQEQTRHEPVKSETRLRRDDRREDRREDNLRRDAVKKEDLNKEKRTIEGPLYFKRGELISSTWNRPA